MKTIALIGLGTITKHYAYGLANSSTLSLCAVCDIVKHPKSLDSVPSCPFYTDYKEMIDAVKPDYVMISTPPSTHFEIAEYALTHSVNVIVEKPAVLCIEDYDRLANLARKENLVFEVAFHWQKGSEVERFGALYDPKRISEISVSVLDPYSADGLSINDDKVNLMGAWIDSGVNILSMIRLWLPFDAVSIESLELQRCTKTGLPIMIDARLKIDGVPTRILVDWRKNVNQKCTELVYEGRKITIRHSMQRIEDGDQIIDCCQMPRLAQHYYSYFADYKESADQTSARDIHRILLEVKSCYEKSVP